METINHECYVSPEVAKLLREAGFDWECVKNYMGEIDLLWTATTSGNLNDNSEIHKGWKSTPTLEVAQRWLREVKGIYTMVFKDFATIDGWHYFVVKKEDWESGNESNFYQQESNNHTYEEAQEAGIKKALEIILEK